MISYNEAIELIKREFDNIELETEEILLEEATNRTLAEDVYSDIDLPPFDNSAVDGYAIIYDENVTEWNLIGEISAGNYKKFSLDKNSTVSIMTGSKIPATCSSVIPLEDVDVFGNKVKLKEGAKYNSNMNIRKAGSDIKKDEKALSKGTFLKSRHMATLATCGKSKVLVYKPLKISVLSTGDELIPVNEIPTGDKLRVSNNYAIASMIKELHQVPLNLGFINDNRDATKEVLKKQISSDTDIIITTGGISVGKHDYIKEVLEELDVKEIFWRAYIKPGKPAFFGICENNGKRKLIFGLPGNPVSSLVNFEIYIKPFIMKLFGIGKPRRIKAVLDCDLRKKDTKRHFMKAFYFEEDGAVKVVTQKSQSSGNLVELSSSNCLIEVPEEVFNPKKGDDVVCLII